MKELRLFEELKEAYETSTHNDNKFNRLIQSVEWDDQFYADCEHYFIKEGMTFTTPSLNPFDMSWKPSALFADGSYIEF